MQTFANRFSEESAIAHPITPLFANCRGRVSVYLPSRRWTNLAFLEIFFSYLSAYDLKRLFSLGLPARKVAKE